MSEEWTRIEVVVVTAAGALGVVAWARLRAARRGPEVDVTGLLGGPGVVIFTKDECASCARALTRVEALGLPVRQVRAEDEPEELRQRGVSGVPVTVVIDGSGRPCGRFGGIPGRRALARAVRRAGEIPSGRDRAL